MQTYSITRYTLFHVSISSFFRHTTTCNHMIHPHPYNFKMCFLHLLKSKPTPKALTNPFFSQPNSSLNPQPPNTPGVTSIRSNSTRSRPTSNERSTELDIDMGAAAAFNAASQPARRPRPSSNELTRRRLTVKRAERTIGEEKMKSVYVVGKEEAEEERGEVNKTERKEGNEEENKDRKREGGGTMG
jgi:hypothetical protein